MGDDEIADRRRALIGYVDQGGALIDGMSALENVLLPAVPDGEVEQRTEMAKDLTDWWASDAACGTVPHSFPAVSASVWLLPWP